ncbi:amidohydrolase family protein [candidate division KSB1 bacterium]|nr:amidohydrolase family protein [candidate division KSB1 bacterium]
MFIDIHAHAYKWLGPPHKGKQWFSTPEQLLERYQQLGIDRAVLLPIVNPEVYLPQSNEEILDMVERYPETFIPFCNIDPRALTNSSDAPLGDLLRYYRDRGCKGIGEVMPNLPFLHPFVQNLFKHVSETGFPLIFDISDQLGGDYGLYDDPGLPQLEKCLQKFPNLIILGHGPAFWAEIGQLETPADRTGYPAYPLKEEGVVPKLFRRYPNLWGDLSANSGFNALARDKNYAISFLNEFQDRLLFGTDICAPDQPVPLVEFLTQLRDTNKISKFTFNKIAGENARKLLNLE